MRALRTLWPCLLLIACAASAGEIHKWVDKDGVIHYGDAPPPEDQSQATVVDVRVSQPSSKPYLPATQPTNATAPAANASAHDATKPQVKNGPPIAEVAKGESAEAKRARLIKECEASRGVDCKSPETLARMEKKEKPLTAEERAAMKNNP
jgi:Domain of unknown function (DUF4124)